MRLPKMSISGLLAALRPANVLPARGALGRLTATTPDSILFFAVPAVLFAGLGLSLPGGDRLPDFSTYTRSEDRKAAFFEYLTPIVRAENDRLRDARRRLDRIATELSEEGTTGWWNRRFLNRQAERYAVEADDLQTVIDTLKRRVDIVPTSLALAQAAKESGWGTSRFARTANNLFGQWCFTSGCGVVPRKRPPGATHEVRAFDSVSESVRSYLHNLNTHYRYLDLRIKRAKLRVEGEPLSGIVLAETLTGYSERRDDYVEEVLAMIIANDLEA